LSNIIIKQEAQGALSGSPEVNSRLIGKN